MSNKLKKKTVRIVATPAGAAIFYDSVIFIDKEEVKKYKAKGYNVFKLTKETLK